MNRSRGIRQEIDRLNHMYQKGRISDAYYDEQYNALNERLQNALASENIVSIEAYRPICDLLSDSWQDVYRELGCRPQEGFLAQHHKRNPCRPGNPQDKRLPAECLMGVVTYITLP